MITVIASNWYLISFFSALALSPSMYLPETIQTWTESAFFPLKRSWFLCVCVMMMIMTMFVCWWWSYILVGNIQLDTLLNQPSFIFFSFLPSYHCDHQTSFFLIFKFVSVYVCVCAYFFYILRPKWLAKSKSKKAKKKKKNRIKRKTSLQKTSTRKKEEAKKQPKEEEEKVNQRHTNNTPTTKKNLPDTTGYYSSAIIRWNCVYVLLHLLTICVFMLISKAIFVAVVRSLPDHIF